MRSINHKQKRGFTLIEVVVSLSIFCTALLAISSLFRSELSGIGRSSEVTNKLFLCQGKLEELKSKSFDELPYLNGTTFSDKKGKIEISSVNNDLLVISIEMKPIKLSTMRSSY